MSLRAHFGFPCPRSGEHRVGHERSLPEVRNEAQTALEFGVVAVLSDGGKCDTAASSPETPEERQISGSGGVIGVLVSVDSGELEALLLIV